MPRTKYPIFKCLRRGQKGFTLIELLVVIAILGVIAAVAIPNVTQFIGKGVDEAMAAELHNVQVATSAAVYGGNGTCVVHGSEGGELQITALNSTADDNVVGKYLINDTEYKYWVETTGQAHQEEPED